MVVIQKKQITIEIKMKLWKRILFTLLAWFAAHFAGFFALAAIHGPDNVPLGVIALINIGVAGTVFYLTGKK